MQVGVIVLREGLRVNTEVVRHNAQRCELSIRSLIAHLPHLLPPSLSVHLLPLPLLRTKQVRAERAEKTAETIDNSWVTMVFWISSAEKTRGQL